MNSKISKCVLFLTIIISGCISQKRISMTNNQEISYAISGNPTAMRTTKDDTLKIDYHQRDSNYFEDFSLFFLREIYFYPKEKREKLLTDLLIDTVMKSNNTVYFINNGDKKHIATISADSIELKEIFLNYSDSIFNCRLVPSGNRFKIGIKENIKFDVQSGWDSHSIYRYVFFDKNFRAIEAGYAGIGGRIEMVIIK